MWLIQRAGITSSLPYMPVRLVSGVPVRGIPPVHMFQCLCQTISRARNRDQVDMIGHEAIADQRHSVEPNVFPQQIEIDRTISIGIQHESLRVSTLGQMVWNISGDNPS